MLKKIINFIIIHCILEDVNKMPDKEKVLKELNNRNKNFSSTNLKDYWVESIGSTLFGKVITIIIKKCGK